MLLVLTACASGSVACRDQPASTKVTTVASDAAPVDPNAAYVGAFDASSDTPPEWAEAIRAEHWQDALAGLNALPQAAQQTPELKYARARTLIALGKQADAVPLLDGLEASLPLLGADIARRRADAELAAGPFDKAGEAFAQSPTPAGQLLASRAFEKASDAARAVAACDRVVQMDKRTRAQEAEARARRIRLGLRDVAATVADARWLSIHAPDLDAGKEADATLRRLDPTTPLTGEERMKRAQAFADAGKATEALAVLADVPGSPGKPVPEAERQRARAYILYKAHGRYVEAAVALSSCAQAGGAHAAEDAFHAARALSRADRDESAQVAYRTVAQKYRGTTWATDASFLAARIDLMHGHWEAAARAFDQHVQTYGSAASGESRETPRDRALSHLMAGHYKVARRLYEQMSDAEAGADALAPARAATMAALAAYKDGERTAAIARWTDVARSHPLTWPALVSRARLASIGAPVPPAIDLGDTTGAEAKPKGEPKLPPPASMLHALGFDDDAEEALKSRETALVASAPARPTEALCEAYGSLGRASRRLQVSLGVPSSLLATEPTARNRWAWDCSFPQPYISRVQESASREQLDPALIYGVMRQESAFDASVVSPARAVGLLQLMPETAKTLAHEEGSDEEPVLTDPAVNVALGSHYLHDLLTREGGQMPLAVAAYNAGEEAVDRWKTRGAMDVDTFVERIPYGETRTYVVKVMGNVARYGFLEHGEAGVPPLKLALD